MPSNQDTFHMQQMSEDEQRFYGQMWIKQISNLPNAVTEDSSELESHHQPHSVFARLAAEAQHLWCSGSFEQQFVPSCSSICSSASTISGSMLSSAPSMASSATFGSMPGFDCIDMTGYQYPQNSRTCEPTIQQPSADSMPSTYWVGSSPWGGVAQSAPGTTSQGGAVSTLWNSCEEDLEEFSLGSGYEESRNGFH